MTRCVAASIVAVLANCFAASAQAQDVPRCRLILMPSAIGPPTNIVLCDPGAGVATWLLDVLPPSTNALTPIGQLPVPEVPTTPTPSNPNPGVLPLVPESPTTPTPSNPNPGVLPMVPEGPTTPTPSNPNPGVP
jgi:hypothetical protein